MSLFPECNGLNKNHRDDPGIWSTTPEFGSKRTPNLRSTVPNAQRHMAYFAGGTAYRAVLKCIRKSSSPAENRIVFREIDIHGSLVHPNIAACHGFYEVCQCQ